MGTEVLRPQDLLFSDRFGAPFYRRKQFPSKGTVAVNRKQIHGGSAKKASPKLKKGSPARSDGRTKDDGASSSPAMGQVTILRRGQSLDSFKGGGPKPMSPEVKQADRNGGPELSPRRILAPPPSYLDGYAGSAFALSPSPRSLPLPSFFSKVVDVSATRDLRRLLRLE